MDQDGWRAVIATWAMLGIAARGAWVFRTWRRESDPTSPPEGASMNVPPKQVMFDKHANIRRLLRDLPAERQEFVIRYLLEDQADAVLVALRAEEQDRWLAAELQLPLD